MKRCVNIDWLEVYVLENQRHFPCDADYFRRHGYFVKERDYGTRSYSEMFTIEDAEGNPWIEVRRNPQSGDSSFTGLVPESCHLRLVNRACYEKDCVQKLRDFMILHEYTFVRIFRIDVCYDFEYFDSGDLPSRFARRYVERKYRKVNQAKLHSVAVDSWADFEWETLSWGNPKSMVSTKMYNKTKELASAKNDKPYIRYCWWLHGLIDDPINNTKKNKDGALYKPEIWRVEFSMKSQARNWLVIEDISGKKVKHRSIPHTLQLFDSKDKLWQRFQDLAYHYFHFKIYKYKSQGRALVTPALMSIRGDIEMQPERKDRCPEKFLFKWDAGHEFLQIDQLPKESKPDRNDEILKRRLQHYQLTHLNPKIHEACEVLLQNLSRDDMRRLSTMNDAAQVEVLQRALSIKMKWPEKDVAEIIAELRQTLAKDGIF